MTKPRKEFAFATIQTPEDTAYVPKKARDPRSIERFAGMPRGYRMAWQQKNGIVAASIALKSVEAYDPEEPTQMMDFKQLAGIVSQIGIGTAYHLFAETAKDEVMNRRVRLPHMIDDDGANRKTPKELVDEAKTGLEITAEQAEMIEDKIANEMKVSIRDRETLGYDMARTSLLLAAINSPLLDGSAMNAEATQLVAWKAARDSHELMLQLTKDTGARPTFAQLADPKSPLMQHLYDTQSSISQANYVTLTGAVDVAIDLDGEGQA